MDMPAVSANDVAAYILKQHGPMTAMKLQKLLYYCQAWSLVWDEKKLFREKIEAWVNGPVVPKIYDQHRGKLNLTKWEGGNPEALDEDQKDTVQGVLNFYGGKTAQWLSDLSHKERPWLDARKGLSERDRGSAEITLASMEEYYSSVPT